MCVLCDIGLTKSMYDNDEYLGQIVVRILPAEAQVRKGARMNNSEGTINPPKKKCFGLFKLYTAPSFTSSIKNSLDGQFLFIGLLDNSSHQLIKISLYTFIN